MGHTAVSTGCAAWQPAAQCTVLAHRPPPSPPRPPPKRAAPRAHRAAQRLGVGVGGDVQQHAAPPPPLPHAVAAPVGQRGVLAAQRGRGVHGVQGAHQRLLQRPLVHRNAVEPVADRRRLLLLRRLCGGRGGVAGSRGELSRGLVTWPGGPLPPAAAPLAARFSLQQPAPLFSPPFLRRPSSSTSTSSICSKVRRPCGGGGTTRHVKADTGK